MSCHRARMMPPKKDTTQELKEVFEGAWSVHAKPNLSKPDTDLKGLCYDFFLIGALAAMGKLTKAGGKE